MNKYVGKYRVVCEFDRNTLKPIKEDAYIYCSNFGQVYRYNDDTLVYYRKGKNQSNKIIKSLTSKGISIIKDCSTADDVKFYFLEKDIDLIAKIFKARITGKDINPTSRKNLRLFNWYKESKTYRKHSVNTQIQQLKIQAI